MSALGQSRESASRHGFTSFWQPPTSVQRGAGLICPDVYLRRTHRRCGFCGHSGCLLGYLIADGALRTGAIAVNSADDVEYCQPS